MGNTVNNVIAQVTGGAKKILDGVSTAKDIRLALNLGENYIASINGNPASDSDTLSQGDFVTFAEKVKGQ
jgi:hypothetical protein